MRIKRSLSAIIATIVIAATPLAASAQWTVGVGIGFGGPGWGVGVGYAGYAPPPLPYYSMPPAPYPGWQWIPGYWGWGSYGYYWIPGYWTAPPAVGLYWTPGYWGYTNGYYGNGYYGWNPGYWGPTVGFYGGINYGYGYFGTGFAGGYWSGGAFNYNTAVVNVNRTVITNTFNRTVTHGRVAGSSRVSFNGGRRGVHARPTPAQLAARRHGVAETRAQRAHERIAARDRGQLAAVNHGHPRVAAVQRPFSAAHRPANMHAITAADRRVAQRTMHHSLAMAHHNAPMRHGTMSAGVHHSAFARHGSVSAPVRHSASMSHGTFSASRHSSFSAPRHSAFSGRSGGGFQHAAAGRMNGGGGGRMGGGGGGRMGGGGGGRGRPPRG